jgi:hypothetical protein
MPFELHERVDLDAFGFEFGRAAEVWQIDDKSRCHYVTA